VQDLGPGGMLLTSYGVLSRDAAAGLDGERRVALTGTPVENRLHELWALLNLLNPGLAGQPGPVPPALCHPDRTRSRPNGGRTAAGPGGPFSAAAPEERPGDPARSTGQN
jgi:hypothetical protein